MPRRAFHQTVFALAGLYNIAWGAYGILDPQWLFRFSGLAPLNHPAIFSCLAMVVGIYGILYLQVARNPEHNRAIAAIGLLGKILGPIGWLDLYLRHVWPLNTIVLILTNDLIWWIPFILYLWDSRRTNRVHPGPFSTS